MPRKEENVFLTTHSTHFIDYMVLDHIVKDHRANKKKKYIKLKKKN